MGKKPSVVVQVLSLLAGPKMAIGTTVFWVFWSSRLRSWRIGGERRTRNSNIPGKPPEPNFWREEVNEEALEQGERRTLEYLKEMQWKVEGEVEEDAWESGFPWPGETRDPPCCPLRIGAWDDGGLNQGARVPEVDRKDKTRELKTGDRINSTSMCPKTGGGQPTAIERLGPLEMFFQIRYFDIGVEESSRSNWEEEVEEVSHAAGWLRLWSSGASEVFLVPYK
ncbi:hypothetical protein F5877DRAFT_72785 [Lentinula edodes]|nr:hypothetical protein F5877DRAFT_72785 [Lentinula edodes]